MSAAWIRFAEFVTRAWSRLYTLGLPDEVGRARRDQLTSDLWEQTHDVTDASTVAFSILGRLIRGVPDDLMWRVFAAPRLARRRESLYAEGNSDVTTRSRLPFYAAACALNWFMTLFFVLDSVSHSLLIAGTAVTLLCLVGWLIEARELGDEAAGSAWPLAVACGVSAVALGAVFEGGRSGLLLSVPAAAAFTAVSFNALVAGRAAGSVSLAVAPEVLHSRARAGDAIALERPTDRRLSRRTLLQGSVWLGLGTVLATTGGVIVDFLWQRNVSGFGGIVSAGTVGQYTPGSKTKITAGKFWLVHLTPEQGGPGFLALSQKCPHLGCTVPWEPTFAFTDKRTNASKRGWFRCPCHQSTYNDAGVRVYGPAPRSMDRMALTISLDGVIEVDTARIEKGDVDNAAYAVVPPEVQ